MSFYIFVILLFLPFLIFIFNNQHLITEKSILVKHSVFFFSNFLLIKLKAFLNLCVIHQNINYYGIERSRINFMNIFYYSVSSFVQLIIKE